MNRGLSLRELAKLSGLGVSTIGNYENGKTEMSPESLGALARCLKTTPQQISVDDSCVAPVHGSGDTQKLIRLVKQARSILEEIEKEIHTTKPSC